MSRSPLLDRPGAVEASGVDEGVAWHYGDPIGEQRAASRGPVLLDLSHRGQVSITGKDRLGWLHTLTTQYFTDLADGTHTQSLLLSAQGHIEHEFTVSELDGTAWLSTEPGRAADLLTFLTRMVFWSDVQPLDASADLAQLRLFGPGAGELLVESGLVASVPTPGRVVAVDGGGQLRADDHLDLVVPRESSARISALLLDTGARPVGTWAADALRIAEGRPRFGLDTDDRTIPNELPWLGSAVHLHKGCYRGQETVARVANLGRAPRRLVRLHLDGSQDRLPEVGGAITAAGRTVGRVGTSAHHHENGPMALGLLKRSIGAEVPLVADGVDVSVEPDDLDDDDTAARPTSSIDRKAFAEFRRR